MKKHTVDSNMCHMLLLWCQHNGLITVLLVFWEDLQPNGWRVFFVLWGFGWGNLSRPGYAEVKYPNLPEYKRNTGKMMLENIRAAMSQDIYIAKGTGDTIAPCFTFHGYRFVEITGIDEPFTLRSCKRDSIEFSSRPKIVL